MVEAVMSSVCPGIMTTSLCDTTTLSANCCPWTVTFAVLVILPRYEVVVELFQTAVNETVDMPVLAPVNIAVVVSVVGAVLSSWLPVEAHAYIGIPAAPVGKLSTVTDAVTTPPTSIGVGATEIWVDTETTRTDIVWVINVFEPVCTVALSIISPGVDIAVTMPLLLVVLFATCAAVPLARVHSTTAPPVVSAVIVIVSFVPIIRTRELVAEAFELPATFDVFVSTVSRSA